MSNWIAMKGRQTKRQGVEEGRMKEKGRKDGEEGGEEEGGGGRGRGGRGRREKRKCFIV